ncbi:ubiquitin-conjugating enzyme/RWD-like protein [Astrocystis sublimbata]|nr:ubiquitin-conjugating enzyme/RWD-like protein [Astrocystis sublimbata]
MSSSGSSRSAAKRLLRELAVWEKEAPAETGIERLGPPNEEELLRWEAVINGQGVGCGYDGSLFATVPLSCASTSTSTPLALPSKPIHLSISLPILSHPIPSLSPTCIAIAIVADLLRKTGGRWLLSVEIPATYPLAPPKMTFKTPIVHANVDLKDGTICLDLLKDAWTPAYSVLECVRAVRLLLSCPGVDSPLNVDVAALLRQGDTLAARRLTEYWCEREGGRYEGP